MAKQSAASGELTHRRDTEITREIHRLFWQANFQDLPGLLICYLARTPALVALHAVLPLVTAYGVDAVFARDLPRVWHQAYLAIGAAAAYGLLLAIGSYAIHKNGVIGATWLQNQVFANFLAKDHEFFGTSFFGALGAQATRLREAYLSYAELATFSVLKQATIVVSGIAVIGYHSLWLAIITLLAMALVLSFTLWSSAIRLKFRRQAAEAASQVAGQIGDALSHGMTVKSFAMEKEELRRLVPALTSWSQVTRSAWNWSIPADAGRQLLAALALAVLLIVTAMLYDKNMISLSIVVLVQLYVIKLVYIPHEISDIIKRYEEVMAGAYEPVKTMLVPVQIQDPAQPAKLPAAPYLLALEKVSFRYPDSAAKQLAVRGFYLSVPAGEKVGLVGYSGSGKTSLTKLLLRFMDVTAGSITINDIDLRDLKQTDLRSIISYVPQEPLLFHRSIADNIGYAKPDASQKELLAAAKLAYVEEFVHDLPKGYETLVGERGIKLSGGQRQRVAIARAILKDAPILVLDEATSALDSKSEQYIQAALAKLMKNRTALVIAHRLSTIQRLDRIVVMDKGRIVQEGTHQELVNQPGIYAELWAHQSGGYLGGTRGES